MKKKLLFIAAIIIAVSAFFAYLNTRGDENAEIS